MPTKKMFIALYVLAVLALITSTVFEQIAYAFALVSLALNGTWTWNYYRAGVMGSDPFPLHENNYFQDEPDSATQSTRLFECCVVLVWQLSLGMIENLTFSPPVRAEEGLERIVLGLILHAVVAWAVFSLSRTVMRKMMQL